MEKEFNIIVCLKQVSDPDSPPSYFQVDSDNKKVNLKGAPPVTSPFDENALEAALRFKDVYGGKITVLSMGVGAFLSKRVLDKSVAVGANELILIQDDAFEDLDGYGRAYVLSAAIRKLGIYDIILCGGQAADSNGAQTGQGIAELLGIPCVSLAMSIKSNDGALVMELAQQNGVAEVEVPTPVLVTINSEIFELRYPTFPSIRAAGKKEAVIWSAADLDIDVSIDMPKIRRTDLMDLALRTSSTTCEFIKGETMDNVGANLALKLFEMKII